MPGNLIFVVIVAVFVAYLLQHWIRRRDHVATARSVDRFSEAMRVLDRRRTLSQNQLASPVPRSYVVSPARPAHPDVVVKRAQAGPPVPARGATAVAVAPRRSAEVASVLAPRSLRVSRVRPATRRLLILLLGIAMLVAGALAPVLTTLPWWLAACGVAGLGLSLAAVRHSVAAQRRAESSPVRPRSAAQSARRRSGSSAVPAPRARLRRPRRRPRGIPAVAHGGSAAAALARRSRQVAPQAVPKPAVAQAAPPAAPQPVTTPVRRVVAVYDVTQLDPAASVSPVLEPLAEPAEPGTWQPVPVPAPAYLLKAKATPRHTPERPGQDHLPSDGNAMALEEEYEDLPAVVS